MRNRWFYAAAKRLFDIVCALLGMVVTSPVWLVAIIGILLSDPGPVFFRANRIGKDNKAFGMWKFRSMRVPRKAKEKSEKSFKADPGRIFPFGAWMRRMKVDELPQLLNILSGSMSVVGPRPAAKDQVQIMRSGKYAIAASVRPGLTSPAALYDYMYGDSVEDPAEYERLVLPTRLELEAYYPKHMGIITDLLMIFYTVICIGFAAFGKIPRGIYGKILAMAEEEAKKETML